MTHGTPDHDMRVWATPPADIAVPISPQNARAQSAREVGNHVTTELDRGRPLYCIVHDPFVVDRIGGFDGRALAQQEPVTEVAS